MSVADAIGGALEGLIHRSFTVELMKSIDFIRFGGSFWSGRDRIYIYEYLFRGTFQKLRVKSDCNDIKIISNKDSNHGLSSEKRMILIQSLAFRYREFCLFILSNRVALLFCFSFAAKTHLQTSRKLDKCGQ